MIVVLVLVHTRVGVAGLGRIVSILGLIIVLRLLSSGFVSIGLLAVGGIVGLLLANAGRIPTLLSERWKVLICLIFLIPAHWYFLYL